MSDILLKDSWAKVLSSKIYPLSTLRISKMDTSIPISGMRYRLVIKTSLECKAIWVGDEYLSLLLSRVEVKQLMTRFSSEREQRRLAVRRAYQRLAHCRTRHEQGEISAEIRKLNSISLAASLEGEEVVKA